MAKITRKQVLKSLVFTALGATPGIVWFCIAAAVQPVVVTCLGAFVGFGLSLPGVSAARVAGGTAGMIIANNAPRSMQGEIMDAFVGGDKQSEKEDEDGGDPGSSKISE